MTIALFATILIPPTINSPLSVSVGTAVFIAAVVLACVAILSVATVEARAPRDGLIGCFAILFAVSLSALASRDQTSSSRYLGGGAVPFVAFAMLYLGTANTLRRGRRAYGDALRVCAWLGVPLAALAIYQVATSSWPVLDDISPILFTSANAQYRAASSFGNPIPYGLFAALSAICAVERRYRFWLLITAANIAGLLLSASRSGLASLLVGVVLIAAARRQWIRLLAYPVASIGLAILLTASIPGLGDFTKLTTFGRLDDVGDSYSYQFRTYQLGQAWPRITASPASLLFGNGPGSSLELFDTQQLTGTFEPRTFDNAYITLWYEQGLIGVLTLTALLVVMFVRSGRLGRVLILSIALNLLFWDGLRWPLVQGMLLLAYATEGKRTDREPPGLVGQPLSAVSRVLIGKGVENQV